MIRIIKYIIFKTPTGEYARTFPERKLHYAVAGSNRDDVVAAGFAHYDDELNTFECYGHSESLNIASRPQDTDILNAGRG